MYIKNTDQAEFDNNYILLFIIPFGTEEKSMDKQDLYAKL